MKPRELARRIQFECGEGNRGEFDVDGAEVIIAAYFAAQAAEIDELRDVLLHLDQRTHSESHGCDACCKVRDKIRAALVRGREGG